MQKRKWSYAFEEKCCYFSVFNMSGVIEVVKVNCADF